MSEIETWRDCRRPSEKERERNTEIKADYRRPSEGEEENIEMRAGDESGLHRLLLALRVIEMKAYVMALAERGNKNNATVTEASDH